MPARSPDQRGGNLSREVWLGKALDVLSSSGGQKPRIDSLVAEIGVSRGSFYWHFKDRADFIEQLVQYWNRESTLVVAEHLDAMDVSAAEKLRLLMEMVCVNQLTRHDQAVRNWALGESDIQRQVEKADAFRQRYVKNLLLASGFSAEHADFRAAIFVSEASREGLLFTRLSAKQRLRRAELFYELLMSPPGE